MAVQIKATVFFEAASRAVPQGWTETWYTKDPSLDAAQQTMGGYADVRRKLLGAGARIRGWRLSDVNLADAGVRQRNALTFAISGTAGDSPYKEIQEGTAFDPSQTSLLIQCISGGERRYRRSWWLSGLPDMLTDQLNTQGLKAAFISQTAFRNLLDYISKSPGFRIKTSKVASPGPPIVYTYADIALANAKMVRNRKRGRPFDLFRGKRSN